MTGKKWDDENMEQLLRNMPAIQDQRAKSDVLARLKQDERLQGAGRKKSNKWIPAFVAVAALLVLSILIPSMIRGNHSAVEDKAMESRDTAATASEEMATTQESGVTFFTSLDNASSESHVILPNEWAGMQPFRIGLSHAATVIPVTFMIPEERIATDFSTGNPDSVALYTAYAPVIPETELGFDDYHPYKGKLMVQENTIVHQVSEGHGYDQSSAASMVYEQSFEETFIDHLQFKTVDAQGELANFNQVGKTEIHTLPGGKRLLPYYKYTMPSGIDYLIPEGGEPFSSVKEALMAMQQAPDDLVVSLIPTGVTYNVRVEQETATISFNKQLDIAQFSLGESLAMIEGFMLTASNYDMQISFDNVLQEQVGKYDLTEPLPQPIGVNPIEFSQ
ncbi:hypothetical protein MKY34_16670 [Sporosarcina sp. FSL K6-1522]|uniref:hypothetical protein n=1 Tax=Sporosarcina sp. FSL K6-1522 TaxID=2921554 RepID=UPI00315AA788